MRYREVDSHSPLPSGSFTSFCMAVRPMVCSPMSSARLLADSAAANSSAAPDVPASMRIAAGSVTDPSPDAAVMVSRVPPRVSLVDRVPLATKSRARSIPLSSIPDEVRLTSITSFPAPFFVNSAI